jgi:hypothetical protein
VGSQGGLGRRVASALELASSGAAGRRRGAGVGERGPCRAAL